MLELLSSIEGISGHILRILTITLGGLGVIYTLTRQMGIKISFHIQHIIAMITMMVFSGVVTIIYHATSTGQMIWESIIFWLISNVVYVLFADTLYTRMDHYLDKKLGDDE